MTATADALRETAGHAGVKSREARRMLADLMRLEPDIRRGFTRGLPSRDLKALYTEAQTEMGTPYGLWVDDPVGFVEDVLDETTWSKQREILMALTRSKRVAVPSAFGTGKTHLAARAALWRCLVFPVGTSLTVTTATRQRQVQRQLWPHIRAAVAKAKLPLEADMTQLHARNADGVRTQVAYGFSAPPHQEEAVQGIHAPRLFIVVDEAGGISRVVGKAMRGLLTGDDTRMLAIGNPPTDAEGSWFENLCDDDKVETIRISAYDAPLLSGEVTDWCRACPQEMGRHRLGIHITDPAWVQETIEEYGDEAPFVVAKVHARFPKDGATRAIPADWVDMVVERPEPETPGVVAISDLVDEELPWLVKPGAWVRLGVDVAADGGDELAVSRIVGDLATIQHTSAGATNSNAVDVAGKVLVEIRTPSGEVAGTPETPAVGSGGVQTYATDEQPIGLGVDDEGHLWFDTNDGNKPYRWDGSTWVAIQDDGVAAAAAAADAAQQEATDALTAAQAAQAAADGSIRTYYASEPPWANGTTQPDSVLGDMWFDQDDGQAYRWNGTAWQIIEDTSIAAALAAAQNAQTTADGKVTAFYQAGPTGPSTGMDVGRPLVRHGGGQQGPPVGRPRLAAPRCGERGGQRGRHGRKDHHRIDGPDCRDRTAGRVVHPRRVRDPGVLQRPPDRGRPLAHLRRRRQRVDPPVHGGRGTVDPPTELVYISMFGESLDWEERMEFGADAYYFYDTDPDQNNFQFMKMSTAGVEVGTLADQIGMDIFGDVLINDGGELTVCDPINLAPFGSPETWHTVGSAGEPAFQNTWTAWDTVAFKEDAAGTVHIRGRLDRGGASGTVAFTLPVGYRPTYEVAGIPAFEQGNLIGTLTITTGGAVEVWYTGTPNWVAAHCPFQP